MATNELVTADESYRHKIDFPRTNDPVAFYAIPICAMGVPDFIDGDVEKSVTRDRDCGKFAEWLPALSPKEHADMIRESQMREWQEAQADRANWRANCSLAVAIGAAVLTATINLVGIFLKGEPNITIQIPSTAPPNPPAEEAVLVEP